MKNESNSWAVAITLNDDTLATHIIGSITPEELTVAMGASLAKHLQAHNLEVKKFNYIELFAKSVLKALERENEANERALIREIGIENFSRGGRDDERNFI